MRSVGKLLIKIIKLLNDISSNKIRNSKLFTKFSSQNYRINQDVDFVETFYNFLIFVPHVFGVLVDDGDLLVGVAVTRHEILVHKKKTFGRVSIDKRLIEIRNISELSNISSFLVATL